MRAAKLLFALLAPGLALAQLQLFVVSDGVETAVGTAYTVGQVAAGDKIDTTFRVRNVGTASTSVQTLTLSGVGFSLPSTPSLPFPLVAGAMLSFQVRFQPTSDGSFSANLAVNGASTILIGSSLAAAAVLLEQNGATTTLASGTVVNFGAIELGSSTSLRFTLTNQSSVKLSIDPILVTGDAFTAPDGITSPLTLNSQASVSIDIYFTPQATGVLQGALRVGAKTFVLQGTGTSPPLPAPQLVIEQSTYSSAQQPVLKVKLSETARVSGTGEVQLVFTPLLSGGLDPAIQFTSVASRYATFTVTKGEDWARFDGSTEIVFQTGTTAGSLVFTAKLGDYSDSATVTVAAAAPSISSTRGLRSGSTLDIQLSGHDNARSISQLTFTFYNEAGAAIAPGTIAYNATSDFQTYFASAQKDVGGLFSLRVTFTVTGKIATIYAVDVGLINSVGTTTPSRIVFE